MTQRISLSRRSLLALSTGGLAAVAGCLTSVRRWSTADRTVGFGDPATIDGRTLTLANPRIRKGIVEDAGIWQDVRCGDGQFLVVDATTAGPVADRLPDIDLTSVVGENEVVEDVFLTVEGRPGDAPRSPARWDQRRIAFAFPDDPPDAAAVRWRVAGETARWPLDADQRERLGVEPAFRLSAFEVVRAGEDVRVTLQVDNTGDREGRFLAKCSHERVEDASSVITATVSPADSASYSGVPRILQGIADAAPTVTLAYTGKDAVEHAERSLPEDA